MICGKTLKTTSTSKILVSAPHRCQSSKKAVGTRHGENSVATLVYSYSHRLGQLIVLYSVVDTWVSSFHGCPFRLVFYPASNKLIQALRFGTLWFPSDAKPGKFAILLWSLFIKPGCIYNNTVGHASKTVLPLVGNEKKYKAI